MVGVVGLWLRRLGGERAAALAVAGLVFATALAVAAAPRLLEQRADRALAIELRAASAFERTTIVYEQARPQSRPLEAYDDMVAAGIGLEAGLPPEVRRLIAGRSSMVETTMWEVLSGSSLQSVLRLRIHDGIFERLRLVSGRLPSAPPTAARDERPIARPDQFAWAYEALLPADAAAEMQVDVGDRLPLGAWLVDQQNVGVNLGAVLVVVGTYELADPAADFWINDAVVGGWRVFTVGTNDFLETTALLGPASYPTLAGSTRTEGMSLAYQHRFFTDTDRLTSEVLPATASALRRVEASIPRTGISDIPSDTRMTSGLLRLLEEHQQTWLAAQSVLAFIGLGVLAIAVCTLAVVTTVASGGRRHVAMLFRARGATDAQLMLGSGLEALLLGLPPAVLALGAAMLLVPAATTVAPLLLAGLIGLLAALLMLLIVRRAMPAGQGGAGQMRLAARLTPRRLVIEASLVGGALGAAWLLRERGIAGGGPDPLIAGVLGLVGLAAGLVAMRLYSLPARLLGWLVARRRDLLPVLAVRRAVRGGSSALVLLLLVATATVGAFASATLVHLERGARLAAWHEVGADYRLSSPTQVLPAGLDQASLPGVVALANASLRSVQTSRGSASLLAFEPRQLAETLAGTPAEPALPEEMLAGGSPDVLPAIVGGLDLRAGDTFEATINQVTLRLRASRTSVGFPGVPPGRAFVALASDQLGTVLPGGPPRPSMALLRASPTAADELRATVAQVAPWLTLESRAEREAQRLAAPVMDALRALIGAATGLALAYAALAIGAALALAAAAQRQEIAHLRALGLARRGSSWLSLLEYGPAALAGYLIGAVLGLALFAFIVPALGLGAIVGIGVGLPATLDGGHLLALLGAMVSILIIGWLVGVLAQRDTNPATAIRRGID